MQATRSSRIGPDPRPKKAFVRGVAPEEEDKEEEGEEEVKEVEEEVKGEMEEGKEVHCKYEGRGQANQPMSSKHLHYVRNYRGFPW